LVSISAKEHSNAHTRLRIRVGNNTVTFPERRLAQFVAILSV